VGVVCSIFRIVARGGQEEDTLRAIRSFAAAVKAQPGCASAEVLREADRPAALVYSETWLDEAHLEQHVRSPEFDLILALAESSAESPTVEFRFLSQIRGLAWVAELRDRGRGGATQA